MAIEQLLPSHKLEAWEHNETDEDPRLDHKCDPNRPVDNEHLAALGVLSWKIDVADWEASDEATNPELEEIKRTRGYKYCESVTVSPDKLPNYEEKLAQFYREHLHPYDESRLILEGSGYWDIRDYDGRWIRFRVEKGDLIVLPPGMYHRFTLDTDNYIKALLLFTECPKRVDIMKPDGDDLVVRKEYVNSILMNHTPPYEAPVPITIN